MSLRGFCHPNKTLERSVKGSPSEGAERQVVRVIKTCKNAMVDKSEKIASGTIQSTGNSRNRVKEWGRRRKRENVSPGEEKGYN